MKNYINIMPVKVCEKCKYRKINVKGHYYCHVYELDEDVAFYWDNYYIEGSCYGFNNDEIFY